MQKRNTRKRSNSLLLESFSRSKLSAYFVSSIQNRIKEKREQGLRLNSVEAHLSRKLRKLEQRVFGPSPLRVTLELLKSLSQPLPVLLILALILAAETSSKAYFPEEEMALVEDSNLLIEDLAVAEQQELEEGKEVFASLAERNSPSRSQASSLPEDYLADRLLAKAVAYVEQSEQSSQEEDSETIQTQQALYPGLIEFISGVISVYCPSTLDPGAIARQIVQISHQEQVDPIFVASLIATESSFRTHARSHAGALGLMQLIPSTAKEVLSKQKNKNPKLLSTLTEPKMNIRLGISYYKQLLRRFHGDTSLALAAYNWGPTNVDKAGRRFQACPGSVRQYSEKIQKKAARWNRQFAGASKTAREFQETLAKLETRSDKPENT